MLPQHSVEDFACILRACRKTGDLLCFQQLQAYMHKNGLETHVLLGNHLVLMHVEAGNMHDAHQIFDKLLQPNEHSWTSLITGYVKSSRPQHALAVYEDMQEDHIVHPSGHTFVALLKACAKLKNLEKGLEIHSKIDELGLSQKDVFIGSALLDMYSKCGSLLKAREVFNKLPTRNVVCWNALISAYVECGHGKEALSLFEKMQLNGVHPDAITFICSLKACTSTRAVHKGMELHFELERQGLLDTNLNVGNALIDMYAKCGLPFMANQVFDKLPVQDVVSWTALIAGYAEHGHAEKALSYFDLMRKNGIGPNSITYICCLKACGRLHALSKGQELHADIENDNSLKLNPVVGNSLVDMYAKCGVLTKAKQVFDKLTVKDAVSWTSLITGYAEHERSQEVVRCFDQMELEGVPVDATLLVSMLKACVGIRAIDKGHSIHCEIERQGLLKGNSVLGNTLVDMYAKFGLMVKSRQVFDSLPVQNLVSWNALMAGYAELGLAEQTINCLERMKVEGVFPDAVTFVCTLKACGIMGATDKGTELHAEIERRGLLLQDKLVGSILVDMYARCGSPIKAQEVLCNLPTRDVVSWTALMEGYAQLGESENVFSAFESMVAEHIIPDPITFVVILSVCSQKGLFAKTQTFFEIMSKTFGIAPIIKHQNCMLDLFMRSGYVDQVVGMIGRLPFLPDLVTWRTVLGACGKWGNSEYAKHVFEHATALDRKNVVDCSMSSVQMQT